MVLLTSVIFSRRLLRHWRLPLPDVSSSLPRSFRTARGSFSPASPANVARTTLCEFADPSDFVSTFWMPQDSTTARTAPPAMMPVPSGAGLSSTWPAPNRPEHRMRHGRALERHADQRLLRRFDSLLDGRRHFLRLAHAEAHDAMAVADHDERAEAQVLAALDDLGDAADVHDRVLQIDLRRVDFLSCVNHIISFQLPASSFQLRIGLLGRRHPCAVQLRSALLGAGS